MANIYLHIGTHKTGTTAIQDYLDSNRAELLAAGYLYPRTGHYINAPHQLAWVVKRQIPQWVKNVVGQQAEELNPRDLFTQLDSEIKECNAEDVIISSESFYIDTKTELLKELLAEHSVKVIMYVRPQDEILQSLYSQALKDPNLRITQSVMEYYKDRKYPYDYYEAIQPWIEQFGEASIVVRPYKREYLYENDLCQDFLNVCGLNQTKGFTELTRNSNKRLDIRIMEFLRKVYKLDIEGNELKQLVHDVLIYNEKIENSPLFSKHSLLSIGERNSIIRQYKESNAKLKSIFMVNVDESFLTEEITSARSDEEDVPCLSVGDSVEMAVGLWSIAQHRIQ